MPETGDGGTRPVPDPTVLTTEALLREIHHLEVLLESRIAGVERRLELTERQRTELKADSKTEVEAAIASAEKLEIQRFESLKREMQLITDGANAQIADMRRTIDELRERLSKVV